MECEGDGDGDGGGACDGVEGVEEPFDGKPGGICPLLVGGADGEGDTRGVEGKAALVGGGEWLAGVLDLIMNQKDRLTKAPKNTNAARMGSMGFAEPRCFIEL